MSDSISRQALRNAMYHEAFETDTDMQRWDSGCWIRYKLFENTIDKLPSAERVGKWKRRIVDNGWNADWVCSECGYRVHYDFVNFNYCPNCGARMVSEE